MFDNIENLKIVSSLHKTNRLYNTIESRSTHSFIIRIKGSILYDFYDKSVTVNEGEMMFIPQGTSYKYRLLQNNEGEYTSINFLGTLKNPLPTLFSLENFSEAEYLKTHFTDLWKFGSPAEKYNCISLFYKLLAYVSTIEHTDYADKCKFNIIEPAVCYLKEHIYDCTLKTDKLHKLCGISGTYFRKIFISQFGLSPQNYIISKRLSHAKSVFDSGDFDTVKEVAISVGYSDPLYFGKAFRKMYGISPSEIGK